MLIGRFYDDLEIHRERKYIAVRFVVPHKVISTCRVNGGLRDDLKMVFIHQVCEPVDHYSDLQELAVSDPRAYFKKICGEYEIPGNSASLGTAANVNCASIRVMSFRDLGVLAICTAGVEVNAGRAGDPADIFESNGKFEPISKDEKKEHGTINIIVCINKPLANGAMVRSVITATEAKTAALLELNINSRYSCEPATGTGTDQIAVASKLTDEQPLTGAGNHTKLGELIGRTVTESVKEALNYQSKLTPEKQRSIVAHLERFGISADKIKKGVKRYLAPDKAVLFEKNFPGVDRDPIAVAATAALVHLWDKIRWKILPGTCLPDILVIHGAHLAAATACNYDRLKVYRERLSGCDFKLNEGSLFELICRAIAMGYDEKWKCGTETR